MLPAIQLDGEVITESDDILEALEKNFGYNIFLNEKCIKQQKHVWPSSNSR